MLFSTKLPSPDLWISKTRTSTASRCVRKREKGNARCLFYDGEDTGEIHDQKCRNMLIRGTLNEGRKVAAGTSEGEPCHVGDSVQNTTRCERVEISIIQAMYFVCWGPYQLHEDTKYRVESLYTRDVARETRLTAHRSHDRVAIIVIKYKKHALLSRQQAR